MFKKKKELGDQLAVFQKRERPRFACSGGIAIEGFEGEGLLKNISAAGCCLESVTYADLAPGKICRVRLVPEEGTGLEPFSLSFSVSWNKSSEMCFEAGFSLETPGEKLKGTTDSRLERYMDRLKEKGIQPEYGT